jgi:hypothetical protein
MTPLLLLSAVLAAPDAGVPPKAATHSPPVSSTARSPDAGVHTGPADAGVRSQAMPAARDGGTHAASSAAVSEPSTHIAVQEPARPDAGTSKKKKARADRTDGQSDPQMDALLEQQRAQTEALQQIAAQQRASEEARVADQQARTQRAMQIDGARSNIDGTVQSLMANGSWDAAALQSTRVSLQQSAAAASAAGSPIEARNASEAARFVEAAEAALAQRNPQQAQYYLLQANQLLMGGGGGGGVRY